MAQESLFLLQAQDGVRAHATWLEFRRVHESIKKYRDTLAVMSGQWLEGEAKGLQKGLLKGKAEGLQKGLLKGKAEGLQEAAKNMKAMGMSYEQIAAATGLSEETIKSL